MNCKKKNKGAKNEIIFSIRAKEKKSNLLIFLSEEKNEIYSWQMNVVFPN